MGQGEEPPRALHSPADSTRNAPARSRSGATGGGNPPVAAGLHLVADLPARQGVPSTRRPKVGWSGQVAQLVEQRTENPRVGGSIPSLAIELPFEKKRRVCASLFHFLGPTPGGVSSAR